MSEAETRGQDSKVISSAKLISFCILLSRFLGLAREIICAYIFGAGLVWDAFLIAFLIPNLFRKIFGEGALTAAFVPIFIDRLEKKGKDEAFRVLNVVITTLTVILSLLVVVGIAITFIIPLITSYEKAVLTSDILRITLPFLLFICLAAILGAALNSFNHFLAPAIAPVLYNAVFILALIFIAPSCKDTSKIYVAAWAVFIGGFVELLLQFPPLIKRGLKFKPRLEPRNDAVKEIYALILPTILGLSLFQINELMDYLVAEICIVGDGAVSALGYANRVMQLPLSLIGVAIATASFPALTTYITRQDRIGFASVLSKSLKTCLFISIPASLGIMVLSEPIIRLLFERGEFTPEATERASFALLFYASGIWCYCANQVLTRAFFAQKDTKTPVRISMYIVGLNFLLNITLVFWTPLKEAGIALATAVSGCVNFVWLMTILKNRLIGLDTKSITIMMLKSITASIIMALIAVATLIFLVKSLVDRTLLNNSILVIVPLTIAIAFYFLAAYLLKIEELRDVVGGFGKKKC